MGFLFNNIDQLAGFLVNEARGQKPTAGKSTESPSGVFDFHSILNSFGNTAAPQKKSNGLESVEPITLDMDTVKLLLSKCDNQITLEISGEEALSLLDLSPGLKAMNPLAGYNQEAAGGISENPGTLFGIGQDGYSFESVSNKEVYNLKFNPSDLIDDRFSFVEKSIPVSLEGAGSEGRVETVDLSKLMDLIRNRQEPVQLEISILPESESADWFDGLLENSAGDFKPSFKMDLRRLSQSEGMKDGKGIEGLLVFSAGKTRAADKPGSNSQLMIPGQKMAIFDMPGKLPSTWPELKNGETNFTVADSNNRDKAIPAPIMFGTLSSMESGKAMNFEFPNHMRNNGYNIKQDITVSDLSSEALNENESVGTGRIRSSEQDNSSGLSGFSSGSNGASESFGREPAVRQITEPIVMGNSVKGASTEKLFFELPAAPVEAERNIEEIQARMTAGIARGLTHVKMKLHPENLGNLEIKMTWKKGILSAEFKVEKDEAVKILTSSMPKLRAGLEDQKLKVENLNIIIDRNADLSDLGQRSHHRPDFFGEGRRWNQGRRSDRMKNDQPENMDSKNQKAVSGSTHSSHRGWIDMKA